MKRELDVMEAELEGDDSEVRMVLIGKTGSGKSACGNTILGQSHFPSQMSASSVTQLCQVGSVVLTEEHVDVPRSRRVSVVDMPGFGDTELSKQQIHTEIAKCVSLSAPGPHAFLLVVPVGRYTEHENQAIGEMSQIFGEEAVRLHTLVLFTRGDDLEDTGIEGYLRTAPAGLRALIDRCGGRYHVFNNRDRGNAGQVRELLRKVDVMVRQAETLFYTNAMFLEAEAAIMEEQREMLRERGDGEEGNNSWIEPSSKAERRANRRTERSAERRADRRTERSAERRADRWTERSAERSAERRADRRAERRAERRAKRRAERRLPLFRRPSLSHVRRMLALSPRVLERIKILVASVATGMAVGALFAVAVPFAGAAGAFLAGNSVSLVAGLPAVAGAAGAGQAAGPVVALASGKLAVALGAAAGGVMGAMVGTAAASPVEGALETLQQVGSIGVSAVVVGAGVGAVLGAGAALSSALGGAAVNTAAIGAAESAAGQHALATVAANVPAATGSVVGPLVTVAEPNLVVEIGRAVGIAMAGSLVVKVVRETTRTTESSHSERMSYEINWNR